MSEATHAFEVGETVYVSKGSVRTCTLVSGRISFPLEQTFHECSLFSTWTKSRFKCRIIKQLVPVPDEDAVCTCPLYMVRLYPKETPTVRLPATKEEVRRVEELTAERDHLNELNTLLTAKVEFNRSRYVTELERHEREAWNREQELQRLKAELEQTKEELRNWKDGPNRGKEEGC